MEKKKLLVIDDEGDFVKLLRFRLEACGYVVLSAFNGRDGVKLAEEVQPDLILLDVMMPVMDGYSALKELKRNEKTSKIPVIMVSCKEKDNREAILKELDGYIVKPYEKQDLLSAIEHIVGKEEQAAEDD